MNSNDKEYDTLLIKLPKDLKKQLKHMSIEQERTMSQIVIELLEGYIEKTK